MTLHTGDCLDVMPTLAAGSVDAIVTDPPYGLEFMGKAWDSFKATGSSGLLHSPKDEGRTFTNASGHMWDNTKALPRYAAGPALQEFSHRWAVEALRVAKPGAYLLAFGGTRTVHRMTCAIEDAGWVIRDVLVWAYAQGFPKSRASLKPAWEPIVMARKPGLSSPLQIDAARIGTTKDVPASPSRPETHGYGNWAGGSPDSSGFDPNLGRWPANVVLTDPIFDGDVPGVVGGGRASDGGEPTLTRGNGGIWHDGDGVPAGPQYGDTGTYSRFFLIPKADRGEREPIWGSGLDAVGPRVLNSGSSGRSLRDGEWVETHSEPRKRANSHPTVKPLDLMRHLVRLVTPPGGTVLDPFGGSGTTAIACEMEGFPWVMIEREPEYVAIAEARLLGTQRGMGLPA